MGCERERKAVQDLEESIANLEGEIEGATGGLLHGLAGQLQQARRKLPAAKAALATCEGTVSGRVTPNYQLLFVVYAPPGTTGGRGSSSVTYGNTSTLGSTTTLVDSLQAGIGVSAKLTGGVLASATVTVGLDLSETNTDTKSIDVKKSSSWEVKVQGPSTDGIDHDLDLYYLCLKPKLAVSILDRHALNWGYDPSSVPLEIQYVYGGWLKNPDTMPVGVKALLTDAGLTEADYQQILSANPLASGTAIDTNRFLPTDRSFPYEPPYSANDPVPTMTYTQKNDATARLEHKTELQLGVSYSVEGEVGVVFKASLKVTGTFKWTHSSTLAVSTESAQSAAVTISGPSFGYTGPTDVLVYWDTIFNSFLFAFPTKPAVVTGIVRDQYGLAVPGEEVVLDDGGRPLRTLTDSRGHYRFYDQAADAGPLAGGGEPIQWRDGRHLSPDPRSFTLNVGGVSIRSRLGQAAPDIILNR